MAGVRRNFGVALAIATMLLACALLAAPALAQANAEGGTVQYVDCRQIQLAAADQYNSGNTGVAGAIAQNLNIDQSQVLACLDSSVNDEPREETVEETTTQETITEETVNTAEADGDVQGVTDDVLADTIVKGVLPNTGGLSLPALAAYALVITGLFSVISLFGGRR